MKTRRNILALMGIAGASAAVAAESVANPEMTKEAPHIPGLTTGGPTLQEGTAKALEALAASIRRGDAHARGLDIHSSAQLNEWIQHKVTITLELPMG